ncbi:hypothetical protein M011DRAFT_17590 [Sporormia fimetaria CBS 119925]|uniref:Uncharacterized protein n=1 Tax=Sporormia fimetaria CBS 119925 TaxID=1340428 RepID=A0A6A6VPN8_9PLEO|nr:hypothetical protein M011DRAFT_17590 [Sporormia fimetaria CBS 119925]
MHANAFNTGALSLTGSVFENDGCWSASRCSRRGGNLRRQAFPHTQVLWRFQQPGAAKHKGSHPGTWLSPTSIPLFHAPCSMLHGNCGSSEVQQCMRQGTKSRLDPLAPSVPRCAASLGHPLVTRRGSDDVHFSTLNCIDAGFAVLKQGEG